MAVIHQSKGELKDHRTGAVRALLCCPYEALEFLSLKHKYVEFEQVKPCLRLTQHILR
jgi:hypothetical protein